MSKLNPSHHSARLFRIEVSKVAGSCRVGWGTSTRRSVDISSELSGKQVLTVVAQEDLSLTDAVGVDAPHAVIEVREVQSVVEPPWVSAASRRVNSTDIVTAPESLRLANGWAPREMVGDESVRWIGSIASLEAQPSDSLRTLDIAGVIGPCLGRAATVSLCVADRLIATQELDLEDGQPFAVSFEVPADAVGSLEIVIDRPQPRFTPHDSRILNLLVKEIGIR